MKILFISHEGTRTGAPFVLLHFINWLKKFHKDLSFDTLILSDGDLVSEFRKNSETVFLKQNCYPKFAQKILGRINGTNYKKVNELSEIKSFLKGDYDVIYANSIASLNMALQLKAALRIPLILHIHELKLNIQLYCPDFAMKSKLIDKIICVSKAVQDNLLKNFDVNKRKTTLVYEFIDQNYMSAKIKTIELKNTEKVTICASGTLNWRKNPDTFLQVALLLKKMKLTNFELIWVGANDDNNLMIYNEDIKKADLEDYVKILGKMDNPFEIYNSSKLFLMTSKEDPFPLVCIEAGLLGKPIICFENSGGIPEMLEQGGGKVIPYLDNLAMAEAIVHYLKNEDEYAIDSEKIKLQCQQYTVEHQGPKLLEVIKSFES